MVGIFQRQNKRLPDIHIKITKSEQEKPTKNTGKIPDKCNVQEQSGRNHKNKQRT